MSSKLSLHPDRLFSSAPTERAIARRLYSEIKDLPIISPHGHTDPGWFADNTNFANPAEMFIKPDHYVFRMLYSLGVPLQALGIARRDVSVAELDSSAVDPKEIWRLFAKHYYALRATPSAYWLNHVFSEVFGIDIKLDERSADFYYETIDRQLQSEAFKPRALFERFNIEALATTESPLDPLCQHQAIHNSGWGGRVITTFRPDPVMDPEYEGFTENLCQLSELTGLDCHDYDNYIGALKQRRCFFKQMGATATDHGHPSAFTANLDPGAAQNLFKKAVQRQCTAQEAELFRGHMLVEMAAMSLEDGLVMQIHPGSFRNHNRDLFQLFGRDKGADIPTRTEYVSALKPLLDLYGNEPGFTAIVFTLDESSYSRELAPLAGHYPALKIGPPWWFHDSVEGMKRFRRAITETAGFYNLVGFNDDTRAFLSIPARHDMARRMDCAFLAELVGQHRLDEDEAAEIAVDLTYHLVKQAYRL
ncbi:MAG: glucuronate isomerase [Exilibacterium sp.]